MTRYFSALLFLVLAGTIFGCENVVPADGLPYVNHIVIRGFLVAGQPIDSISVSHTLPLSAPFDPAQAAIPDANVSIVVDGKIIPLQSIGYGFFTDSAHDSVQSGKTYSIDVKWNGLHAWASTLVPQPPVVDSFFADTTEKNVFVEYDPYSGMIDTFVDYFTPLKFGIHSRPNEVYSLLYDSVIAYKNNTDTMVNGGGWGPTQINLIQGNNTMGARVWLTYLEDGNDSIWRAWELIGSFDSPYYDFLRTYNNYNDGGDIFGTGSANPKWNVSGDGIGIFIGEAVTHINVTFRR